MSGVRRVSRVAAGVACNAAFVLVAICALTWSAVDVAASAGRPVTSSSLAAPHSERCGRVVVRNPNGTVYARSPSITATGVGCRAARQVVRKVLADDGDGAPRVRGFVCRHLAQRRLCRRGRARISYRLADADVAQLPPRRAHVAVSASGRRCLGYSAVVPDLGSVVIDRVRRMTCARALVIARHDKAEHERRDGFRLGAFRCHVTARHFDVEQVRCLDGQRLMDIGIGG